MFGSPAAFPSSVHAPSTSPYTMKSSSVVELSSHVSEMTLPHCVSIRKFVGATGVERSGVIALTTALTLDPAALVAVTRKNQVVSHDSHWATNSVSPTPVVPPRV